MVEFYFYTRSEGRRGRGNNPWASRKKGIYLNLKKSTSQFSNISSIRAIEVYIPDGFTVQEEFIVQEDQARILQNARTIPPLKITLVD